MSEINRGLALIAGITHQEGWHEPDESKGYKGSRSFRNNNPGNLRSSPFEVDNQEGYSVFSDAETGRQALIWDLKKKSLGETSTGLNGESTVAQLIAIYAPMNDGNNIGTYLKGIQESCGIQPNEKLKDLFGEIELPQIGKESKAAAEKVEKKEETPAEKVEKPKKEEPKEEEKSQKTKIHRMEGPIKKVTIDFEKLEINIE